MDKMFKEIDIKNEKELLRVYENNLKNASSDDEKKKINGYIAKTKSEINKLEAA